MAVKDVFRLTPEGRAMAGQMCSAFLRFREADPKITVEEVTTLLIIAANPGIVQKSIGDMLELTSGSLSRTIGRLSRYGDRNTPGLALIEVVEDPQDRRQKPLHLTKDGTTLVAAAIHELEGGSRYVSKAEGA